MRRDGGRERGREEGKRLEGRGSQREDEYKGKAERTLGEDRSDMRFLAVW